MVMEEEGVMVTVTMMGVMGIVMDTQVMHEPRNIVTIVRVSQLAVNEHITDSVTLHF